jgi:hypothetical protein
VYACPCVSLDMLGVEVYNGAYCLTLLMNVKTGPPSGSARGDCKSCPATLSFFFSRSSRGILYCECCVLGRFSKELQLQLVALWIINCVATQ